MAAAEGEARGEVVCGVAAGSGGLPAAPCRLVLPSSPPSFQGAPLKPSQFARAPGRAVVGARRGVLAEGSGRPSGTPQAPLGHSWRYGGFHPAR